MAVSNYPPRFVWTLTNYLLLSRPENTRKQIHFPLVGTTKLPFENFSLFLFIFKEKVKVKHYFSSITFTSAFVLYCPIFSSQKSFFSAKFTPNDKLFTFFYWFCRIVICKCPWNWLSMHFVFILLANFVSFSSAWWLMSIFGLEIDKSLT